MSGTVAAYLDFPTFRGSLTLSRTPAFLRFTCAGPLSKGAWGALDQLDAIAKPDDQIFAACLQKREAGKSVRVVRGEKIKEDITKAYYAMIDDGPTEDVLRSNERWREWCLKRVGAQT